MDSIQINQTKEAVEQVRLLARMFDSVQNVAKVLDNVQSIETAILDAENKHAAMMKQIGELTAQHEGLLSSISGVKGEADDIVRKAGEDAAAIRLTATQDADKLVADAKAQADKIIMDAKSQADALDAEAEAHQHACDMAKAEHVEVTGKLLEAKSALQAIVSATA